MKKETVAKLVEDSLTAIYGYAYGKLYDKALAEDLSSEIIIEILGSAQNLKNEAAFWGYAWKIAENTFCKFIRKQELINRSISIETKNVTEVLIFTGNNNDNLDDEIIYRLRRELSLLSKLHREICIAYYVNNKSCSLIAKEFNISVGMVKQHLFKARKLLKEGIKMERKLGEKSYNPGKFTLDFWGDRNFYNNICNKKLPGAILLAAYNCPMTPEELSVELGVAMPYLEEEIQTLKTAGLLVQKGKKLETGIVIISDEYEKKFVKETKDIYHEIANQIFGLVDDLLPKIRTLEFSGNTYDDNRLLFEIINIALVNAYHLADSKSPVGKPNKLALGGNGWVFGHDNDYTNHHFIGVALRNFNQSKTSYLSAVNYRITQTSGCLPYVGISNLLEVMFAVIDNDDNIPKNEVLALTIESKYIISEDGKLFANIPIFCWDIYDELLQILKPVCEIVADCMISISDKAETLLIKTVPKELRSQCSEIAKIHHRLDVAAFIIEDLVENKKLTVPTEKTPLGVFAVRV